MGAVSDKPILTCRLSEPMIDTRHVLIMSNFNVEYIYLMLNAFSICV